MGDRILSVNGKDIRSASHQEAVVALLTKTDRMKLKVQHDPLPSGFREVKIEKKSDEKLGMVIKGGLQGQPGNPQDPADEGVFISKINPGGVAELRSNELQVGQRIIEVNGQSLLGATHSEAVAAMRNTGDSIQILVCDGWNVPVAQPAIQNGVQQAAPEPEVHDENPQPPRPNSAQEASHVS